MACLGWGIIIVNCNNAILCCIYLKFFTVIIQVDAKAARKTVNELVTIIHVSEFHKEVQESKEMFDRNTCFVRFPAKLH